MRLAAMSLSRRLRTVLLGAGVVILLLFVINSNSVGSIHDVIRTNRQSLGASLLRHLASTGAEPPRTSRTHQSAVARIETPERLHRPFVLQGYIMEPGGKGRRVSARLMSCLVHSFSPDIEREAARKFLDPPHDQVMFANSPAVEWFRGELVLVSRIWLDRERYEAKQNWPPNHFADNYLYTQRFDRFMQPLDNGSIIGIPAPKQWWIGDGPIEPRLTKVAGRLFITFNAAMAFEHRYFMDFTVMWDYLEHRAIIPRIRGGSPMRNATEKNDMPRDKHWMALLQDDQLYFVQNLDPLRIMHCTLSGTCTFIHQPKKTKFIFEHSTSHLRGGTPFVHYSGTPIVTECFLLTGCSVPGDYYFSIAHSTMYKKRNHHRYYTAHLVVLRVRPYRLVYVSNDLKAHPAIYRSARMVRPMYIDDGFIFPVGLILENPDEFILGVHVNDFNAILLRYKGMRKLMEEVIKQDELAGPRVEPRAGLVHKHVHDVMEQVDHRHYIHAGH